MPLASPLRRSLLIALAALALTAPAGLARPADLRSEGPTSALSGTSEFKLNHLFDPYPVPPSRTDAALAQERAYSSYGEPPAVVKTTPAVVTDGTDGVAWLPFVLALWGALIVGAAAGSALHAHRRHPTRLAT